MNKRVLDHIISQHGDFIRKYNISFTRLTSEFDHGIFCFTREITTEEKLRFMDSLSPVLFGDVEAIRKGKTLCIFNTNRYSYVRAIDDGVTVRYEFTPRK